MLVLIDHADVEEIERLFAVYPYDGVTTNPSILKKAGKDPLEVLKQIRDLLPDGAQLHAQVIAEEAEAMAEEAEHMWKALGNQDMYVKIPVSTEGLKAMSLLKKRGAKNITATAIYTAMQAFMAAKAGARYTAPYVNRIDMLGADGVQTAQDIHTIFKQHNLCANVLGASFKNAQQILALCLHGVGAVTVAPDVLWAMVKHDSTNAAIRVFNDDFHALTAQGKTMKDFS